MNTLPPGARRKALRLPGWRWLADKIIPGLPASVLAAVFLSPWSRPVYEGELKLPSLQGEVEVRFDRWGVPHVRAVRLADLLTAQGYLVAQERMLQLELLRRTARGALAEVMGKGALRSDVFMRKLGLAGKAERMAAGMPGKSLACLRAYADGVNAYLEYTGNKVVGRLPFFSARALRGWEVEDSLLCYLLFAWQADATWMEALVKGRIFRRLGKEEAQALYPPVESWEKGEREPASAGRSCLQPLEECDREFFPYDEDRPEWLTPTLQARAAGCNGVALDGSRTATGRPLLANDLHLPHAEPTFFYLCHLACEEGTYEAIGAALPGMPGIYVGRNRRLAWGAVSLASGAVDLYVEKMAKSGDDVYIVDGSWEKAEGRMEEIRIFPHGVCRQWVAVTGHGPLIGRDGDRGLSLRWADYAAEEADPVGSLLLVNMAGSWEEFRGALRSHAGPATLFIYADGEGNVGYQAAGRIPLREGHDGSLPLPGWEGKYEWRGYLGWEDMPSACNTPEGHIAASDVYGTMALPLAESGGGHATRRQARLSELVRDRRGLDAEDLKRVQLDRFTGKGDFLRREILEAARGREDLSEKARLALSMLQEWDGVADEGSGAQAVCHLTWRVLTERLLRHRLGHRLYYDYVTTCRDAAGAVEAILRERRGEWLPPTAASFEELLVQCLEEALVRLEVRFGFTDIREWGWGRLHYLRIPHYLPLPKALRKRLCLEAFPRGGDAESIDRSPPLDHAFLQLPWRSGWGYPPLAVREGYGDLAGAGPVLRMIIDLAPGGSSRWCMDIGQSSHPLSPYRRNFLPLWREGKYAPMPWEEREVAEVTASRLTLRP